MGGWFIGGPPRGLASWPLHGGKWRVGHSRSLISGSTQRPGRSLVHEQNRPVCIVHESLRATAEDEFARARTAIGSHNDQAGVAALGSGREQVRYFAAICRNDLRLGRNSMPGELPGEVVHSIGRPKVAFHYTGE